MKTKIKAKEEIINILNEGGCNRWLMDEIIAGMADEIVSLYFTFFSKPMKEQEIEKESSEWKQLEKLKELSSLKAEADDKKLDEMSIRHFVIQWGQEGLYDTKLEKQLKQLIKFQLKKAEAEKEVMPNCALCSGGNSRVKRKDHGYHCTNCGNFWS